MTTKQPYGIRIVETIVPVPEADGRQSPPISVTVDTDNTETRRKWDWIASRIGALDWEPQLYSVGFIDGSIVRRGVLLHFTLPPGVPSTVWVREGMITCGAAEAIRNPKVAVNSMRFDLGMPPIADDYFPAPAEPIKEEVRDWLVPGFPVGPPQGGSAGRLYLFANDGTAMGTQVKGASGRTYTLKLIQHGLAQFVAWEADK